MNENELVKLWNDKRSQITNAQMAPALVLIATFVVAAFGKFDGATDGTKYLALGVVAATGILATITQYAVIREAEMLCDDLAKVGKSGALANRIAQSKSFLKLTAAAIVALDLGIFALTYWAIFGM
jgi:hypothetical protein